MATKLPLVPSMIFKSRTTKALSNVTEQKACNRSLFSSTSLMRTSVMTTAVLLYTRGFSDATAYQEHARPSIRRACLPYHIRHPGGAGPVAAQGEYRGPTP